MATREGSRALRGLAEKACRRDVDVEHILDVAVEGVPSDAPLLQQLKQDHRWPDRDLREDGSPRSFPLGRWADVVIAYLQEGIPKLVDLAITQAPDLANFPLSVLEALGTLESIRGVLKVANHAMAAKPLKLTLACHCAKSLNLLVGVPNSVEVPEVTAQEIRRFLHAMLDQSLGTKDLATVCYTLRGVGDEISLQLLKRFPPFPPPYSGIHKLVSTAIHQRLRK